MSERPEVAMIDHELRTVHRAAPGQTMTTDCGQRLHFVTLAAREIADTVLTNAELCATCWPSTHGMAAVVTLASCQCGAEFEGQTEGEAMAQLDEHIVLTSAELDI